MFSLCVCVCNFLYTSIAEGTAFVVTMGERERSPYGKNDGGVEKKPKRPKLAVQRATV